MAHVFFRVRVERAAPRVGRPRRCHGNRANATSASPDATEDAQARVFDYAAIEHRVPLSSPLVGVRHLRGSCGLGLNLSGAREVWAAASCGIVRNQSIADMNVI